MTKARRGKGLFVGRGGSTLGGSVLGGLVLGGFVFGGFVLGGASLFFGRSLSGTVFTGVVCFFSSCFFTGGSATGSRVLSFTATGASSDSGGNSATMRCQLATATTPASMKTASAM